MIRLLILALLATAALPSAATAQPEVSVTLAVSPAEINVGDTVNLGLPDQ